MVAIGYVGLAAQYALISTDRVWAALQQFCSQILTD